MQRFADAGLTWDLVIIDAGLSTSGIKCDLYTEHLRAKTEKLVILSPIPCGYMQSYDEIRGLVKSLLADESKEALFAWNGYAKVAAAEVKE